MRDQGKGVITTSQEQHKHEEHRVNQVEQKGQPPSIRENAKRVFRESGLAELLRSINQNELKGRGRFEEYDSILLFKWGTGYTLRHIWVEIEGDTIRFRLKPHLRCNSKAPLCDGEYHTLTRAMWMDRAFLQAEVKRYYDKPVAESSSD